MSEEPVLRAAPPGGDALIAGGGEMGARVRAFDWSRTPVGPTGEWPRSLITAVRLMLNSRYPMFLWWGPTLVNFYNDGYIPVLGQRHPSALGRPAREIWREIWDAVGPQADRVLREGEATWNEQVLLVMERNNYVEETYFTFSYSPAPDDEGLTFGVFCACTEDTARVLSERRTRTLRALAARTRSAASADEACALAAAILAESGHDLTFALIYLFDENGTTVRLTGTSALSPGDEAAPEVIAIGPTIAPWPLERVLDGGVITVVEDLAERFGPLPGGPWPESSARAVMAPITEPGAERPTGFLIAGLSPRRVFDDDYRGFIELVAGQVAAAVASARALETERKRAEALAELDRAKTTFFSNVSHEFRTPLTLMLGPVADALADPELTSSNRERAELIQRNAQRLLKLVSAMLDFTRIEAGRVRAVYEPTELAGYTADLASAFRSAIERAGLRLVVDTPLLAEPVFVDRDMWEKIVLNLLSNAFKHTFDGEISVRLRPLEGAVELEVSDTGVGIAPDELPRVFERFHRVPNARSRTHEGTGIGLALIQELVKLHGGRISVTSEPDRGTTFTVAIPTGTARRPADRIVASGPEGAAPRRNPEGRLAYVDEALRWVGGNGEGAPAEAARGAVAAAAARILVADDNADMRRYLLRLLGEQGWAVDAVSDGAAALATAQERPPDLVLSDVMMPGLDGFALLRALRTDSRTQAIPVVLLSARAGEESTIEGIAAGADDYLVKPFSGQELITRVTTHLALARLRRSVDAALRESESRFRNMADHAPVMLWVTERDGSCSFLNRSWYDFTGQTPETGLGFGWLDATHPDDREGAEAAFEEANSRQCAFRVEYRLRCSNGEYRRAVDTASPRFGDDGEFLGYVGSVVDVEERTRLLEAEQGARAEAEKANQAKSEFLAAMSHELRTPLNAVGGYVQLIEMEVYGPVSTKQREMLERVIRSKDHLLSLINDVLNFAKLEAGRVEYDTTDVPLAQLVAEVVVMVEPSLAAKEMSCDVDVAGDLVARADAEKLEQILLNLMSNAIKFTDQGGRVTVRGRSSANHTVELTVTDTGIGVPAGKLDMIFEPFVQVQRNRSRGVEGTGLGLAISRDLARGMAGELTVTSTVGVGSTFVLVLPAAGVRSANGPA